MYLTRSVKRNSDAQSLFAGTGYWIEKSDLPFARSDHHVVAVDDLIYILGGLNSSDSSNSSNLVLDEVLIYDTVLDTYTTGPSLPTPLNRFGAGYDETNRRIYVFGGFNDSDEEAPASDQMYILDVDTEEWQEGPALLEPRSDLCGTVLDGMVYAIGGYSQNYDRTLASMEMYSSETGTWSSGDAMRTPRGDCKAVTVAGSVLVLGGYYDKENDWSADSFRSEVEIYNPSHGWRSGAEMKYPRGDKAVVAFPGDRVLVVGGETHNRGVHTNVATHQVQEYIVEEDVWIEKSPLPDAMFRSAAAHVDGMVFVFGGQQECVFANNTSISCATSAKVQVYFDFEHSNIFIN